MLARKQALDIARSEAPAGFTASGARELKNGWFFSWRRNGLLGQLGIIGSLLDRNPIVGSHGVIVNKQSGKIWSLGSGFPLQRDLDAYEAGFECEVYDLKLLSISNHERTADFLSNLRISTVVPERAHGEVWRIPRNLTRAELTQVTSRLPVSFYNLQVYFCIEAIQEAQQANYCVFELIESREASDRLMGDHVQIEEHPGEGI